MPTYLSPGVYMEEVSAGPKPIEAVGTATAAFVGLTETGPVNVPTLVTSWPQYTRVFGGLTDGAALPSSLFSYFLNGGGSAYVVRIADSAPGQPDRPSEAVELARSVGQVPGGNGRPGLTVHSLAPAAEAGNLSVEISDASEGGEDTFKFTVLKDGNPVETFDNMTTRRGPNNLATALKTHSKHVVIDEVKGGALALPDRGVTALAAPAPAPAAVAELGPDQYVGDVSDRTGFGGLEAIEDITMLCVPDAAVAHRRGALDDDGFKAIQLAMIAHCELMGDRVAILDPPAGLTAQQMRDWRVDGAGYDSKHASLYWPWLSVMDPLTGKATLVPPSGAMGGIWARNDETRGVHKAPANEVVRGALDVELRITKGEHDVLNPVGVNCIRAFPGQGIRVWGARTLSSDPEWRYLNVRRLFNFVEKSILLGTNWVVFEPNDPALWDRVRRTISMFLRRIWQSGALFGRTPAEAYFVKCDEENNPPENRDVGILTVEIGIAPVKPAEFVVFRLSQLAAGAALEE